MTIEVAPTAYQVGDFHVTSVNWTGKESGAQVKRDPKGVGIDSGLIGNDPAKFEPGESWSFRFDEPGILQGIHFDEFTIGDADRAVLIIGNQEPIEIEASRVVRGFWAPSKLLRFEAGETLQLTAVEPTKKDLEAAIAERSKPGHEHNEAGPPASSWKIAGLQVLGGTDATLGGHIDLAKPEPGKSVEEAGDSDQALGVGGALDVPDGFAFSSFTTTLDINLTGYSPHNTTQFRVDYSLNETISEPFTIQIRRSLNGTTPVGDALMSFQVTSANNQWVAGNRSVYFNVSFTDVESDYFLLAYVDVQDVNLTNNKKVFAGGLFKNDDGTIHVHGAPNSTNDTIRAYSSGGQGYAYVDWNSQTVYSSSTAFPKVHLRGHNGNDTLRLDDDDYLGIKMWAFGGNGNDTLYGGHLEDRIYGDLGWDSVNARGGNDFIYDSDGMGYGVGGTLIGADGDDTINGNGLAEWIDGGSGSDTIDGGDEEALTPASAWEANGYGGGGYFDGGGGDLIYGGAGNDAIDGGYGNDWISADDGFDTVYGSHDGDYLRGGNQEDVIFGDAGNDELYGDAGNDHLVGGTGNDSMTGGGGHDFFGNDAQDKSHAPTIEPIGTISTRFDQAAVIRLVADDVESPGQLSFSLQFNGASISYIPNGDILTFNPFTSTPGSYSGSITVTDSHQNTNSTPFTVQVTNYNASPPEDVAPISSTPPLWWPSADGVWDWGGPSINGVPLEDQYWVIPSEAQYLSGDTQTSSQNLTYGERLTSDGRLLVDWNNYVKASSRELIKVTDDGTGGGGTRSRLEPIYIYQNDEDYSDPNDTVFTYPAVAVDDAYRTPVNDPYGLIEDITLSGNDVWVGGGAVPAPVYSNPSAALSAYGTVSNFNAATGSFDFDPVDTFDGLITFTYSFNHVGEYHYDWTQNPPVLESYDWLTSNTATVFIHVGTAVKVDLTIEGLDEEDEESGFGALIAVNDDDDNENLIEDRNEGKGATSSEDDLTKISIDYWLRGDAYALDYLAHFSTGTRLWTSAGKDKEILSGHEFTLAELPSEVWVEGLAHASAAVELVLQGPSSSLYTGMVTPAITWFQSDTTASDTVTVTSGLGLTAYRPMQTPGKYEPFKKTAVKEVDEVHSQLGPGIRLNWDHDNGNTSIQDRLLTIDTAVPNENDLIEVRIDQLPGMNNLVLEVDYPPLRLFTTYSGGTPIPISETTGRTGPLSFTNGVATVFVEWISDHGTAEIKLLDAINNFEEQDTLKFHSFESVVIGFSGETMGSSLGINMAYDQQPTYDIAVDFYNRGYDVHYYDVFWHSPSGAQPPDLNGPAVPEVLDAIRYRKVTHVASYGWSHGGGATYLLTQKLKALKDLNLLTQPFTVNATAYIDAVRYDVWSGTFNFLPEPRKPVLTQAHANWYQTNIEPFRGISVPGSDIDLDMTIQAAAMGGQNHVSIAVLAWQQQLVVSFFEQKMALR